MKQNKTKLKFGRVHNSGEYYRIENQNFLIPEETEESKYYEMALSVSMRPFKEMF